MLAYPFVRIIRRHLRKHGLTERWATLRERVGGQCRITATFKRADGRTLHVRKPTQPEPRQKEVSPPPHCWANSSRLCAATKAALAAVNVSSRR